METKMESIQNNSCIWAADLGNGYYRNPVIYADYSDPDVVRVGEDFYMTASSFNSSPGLPILHSKDLVNWQIIAHAVDRLPGGYDNVVRHGDGYGLPAFGFTTISFGSSSARRMRVSI